MLIGDLSRRTGVPRDTIRYYERLGLVQLAPSGRRRNNYKEYAEDSVQRLSQVGELQSLGFTLADIAELLSAVERSADPCADLPRRIEQRMREIDKRIRVLQDYWARLREVQLECRPGCCTRTTGLPSCIPASG